MKWNPIVLTILIMTTAASPTRRVWAVSFGDDTAFLKSHTDLIVLSDEKGLAKVAVAPAWQGRVMTSTAGSDAGPSFGWINRELISSGKLAPHMNAFGGEDRFWMGPEGGQFSIFFAKGAKFEFADWFTPAVFDTLPYKVVHQSRDQAVFASAFTLTNYSGTQFEVAVNRVVRLLGERPGQRRGVAGDEHVVEAPAAESPVDGRPVARLVREPGLLDQRRCSRADGPEREVRTDRSTGA